MNWKTLVAALLFPVCASAQVARPTIPVPQLSLEYTAAPLIAVPDGEDNIVPLQLSKPAPFGGQLYDSATALRWANYLQQAKLRLTEDVVAERRICNANLSYIGQVLELERSYAGTVEEDLRSRVLKLEQRNQDLSTELQNPGIFKSPMFWLGTGVVSTVVIAGVSALVVSQVN